MKQKPKTTEGNLGEIILACIIGIAIALIMCFTFSESEEEIDARQYNEMIQSKQLEGKNVWSDGVFIVIKD